mmetsp:Transcript_67867/g.196391  ORF Transcript_67867/g.196391 Transcript_67867/m.196391 type:complete len:326 (+) Transcript_67867:140-1117(+)
MSLDVERLSLPICGICGVPIRVHVLLPVVAGLAALNAFFAGVGTLGIIMAIIISGPLLLLTVLVHEMGHVSAAKRCGFSPDHILLWPLGGLAYISKEGITPKEQIFVSSMGPATHIPMLALWAGCMFLTNGGSVTLSTSGMWYDEHFVPIMCIAMLTNNIAMLLFNLLVPCIPLDCSQILVSALLLCGCEASTAAKVMVGASVPVIVVLVGLGVWMFATGGFLASMNLVLGCWLAVQTYRLHQARVNGQLATMPLFATAIQQQQAAASQAAANPSSVGRAAGRGFTPFDGTGNVLGRSTASSNEICIGSIVALITSIVVTASVAG